MSVVVVPVWIVAVIDAPVCRADVVRRYVLGYVAGGDLVDLQGR
jgi:hypothetical protein